MDKPHGKRDALEIKLGLTTMLSREGGTDSIKIKKSVEILAQACCKAMVNVSYFRISTIPKLF